MSWFGSSTANVVFEEKVEFATSESIPNGDIDFAVALEISDLIRSKQVPAKDAMRSLKKRLMSAENVNLQKSALKLIDFCIKNGGEHFITEIATKEFMDPLVKFLKDKNINESVKKYMLELIQSWSIMVSTNSKFDYINATYKKLQDDGFQFPMITEYVDSSLIESKVAPAWEDSDACMLCSKLFTFINRKHHCRSCGGVFCGQHSSSTCELPELGINIPVRVCDNCYEEHMEKKKKAKHARKKDGRLQKDFELTGHLDSQDVVDEDLKRAIELSLKESGMESEPPVRKVEAQDYQDEDKTMEAAIAASLNDFKRQNGNVETIKEQEPIDTSTGLYANILPQSKPFTSIPVNRRASIPDRNYARQAPVCSPVSCNRITGIDQKNIVSFIDLLNKKTKIPVEQRRPLQEDTVLVQMYNNICQIQPKIKTKIMEEAANLEKYQAMYSKLFAIGKVYDEILQTRLKQEQYQRQHQDTYTKSFPYNNAVPFTQVNNTGRPSSPTQYSARSPYVPNSSTPPGPIISTQAPLPASSIYTPAPSATPINVPSSPLMLQTNPHSSYESSSLSQTFQRPPVGSPGRIPSLPEEAPYLPITTYNDGRPSLSSIQYAPIPGSSPPARSPELSAASASPVKKEESVVNLIDL